MWALGSGGKCLFLLGQSGQEKRSALPSGWDVVEPHPSRGLAGNATVHPMQRDTVRLPSAEVVVWWSIEEGDCVTVFGILSEKNLRK